MNPARGFAQIVVLVVVVLLIGAFAIVGYQKYSTQKQERLSDGVSLTSEEATALQNKYKSPTPSTSSTDETAGWKTYTNTKYQFSFKYPDKIFTFTDHDTGTNQTIGLEETKYKSANNPNDNYIPAIWLSVVPDKGLTFNDWFNKYVGDGGTNNAYLSVTEKTTKSIAGEQAIEFIGASGDGTLRVIMLRHANNIFEFSSTINFKNEDLTQTLHQILSTFKFTQ